MVWVPRATGNVSVGRAVDGTRTVNADRRRSDDGDDWNSVRLEQQARRGVLTVEGRRNAAVRHSRRVAVEQRAASDNLDDDLMAAVVEVKYHH